MLTFKPLQLEDRELFQGYLGDYRFSTYEYSFLTLYLWRKYCGVEYGTLKDALIIKKNEFPRGASFMQPLGCPPDHLPEIIAELLKIRRDDPAFNCTFRDVEEPFLAQLKEIYGRNLLIAEDTDNFDYIYETQRMINLAGEKLGKRKNHYNQFAHHYNYTIKDITDRAVIADCLALSKAWVEAQKSKHRELYFELAGIGDVFSHLDELNVSGMAVYVDGKIAGFTFGEKVNSQMAIIHVEKGDPRYKGIYAFINKTFAEKYLAETMFINREEDLGLAGLRKAKLAYDPLRLEKKYIVDIR